MSANPYITPFIKLQIPKKYSSEMRSGWRVWDRFTPLRLGQIKLEKVGFNFSKIKN